MRMVFPTATGRLINDLATDMNTFVESVLGEEGSGKAPNYSPLMDIEETSEGYEFAFDLPGVKPDDIHVDLEEDRLTIHGTRFNAKEEKRRIERTFGEFRRVLRLPETVDKDRIGADYEHGVLTVTLPKAAKKGATRIVVSQAGQPSAEAPADQ